MSRRRNMGWSRNRSPIPTIIRGSSSRSIRRPNGMTASRSPPRTLSSASKCCKRLQRARAITGNFIDIAKAEIVGPRKVRFTFKHAGNPADMILDRASCRFCPSIIGRARISPCRRSTPPLSSGPYKIGAFDLGRSITYERVKDYWAKDLPVMRGRYNYDKLVYDFFRDRRLRSKRSRPARPTSAGRSNLRRLAARL